MRTTQPISSGKLYPGRKFGRDVREQSTYGDCYCRKRSGLRRRRSPQQQRAGSPKGLWLSDTGCGHDPISEAAAANLKVTQGKAITISTANGKVPADTVAPLICRELGINVEPYVTSSTPHVLSVGRRCMEQGCSFLWPSGCQTMFCVPNGKLVLLEVHHFIPYLNVAGDKEEEQELAMQARENLVENLTQSHGGKASDFITTCILKAAAAAIPSERPAWPRLKPSTSPGPMLSDSDDGFSCGLSRSKLAKVIRTRKEIADPSGRALPRPEEKGRSSSTRASGKGSSSGPARQAATPAVEPPPLSPPIESDPVAAGEGGGEEPPAVDSPDAPEESGEEGSLVEVAEPDGVPSGHYNHKSVAKSQYHMVTHLPKNRYCQVCQLSK